MGLLIGFVAGLSMTPVVGTMLPLLFAAIGGGAGFFLTRNPELTRSWNIDYDFGGNVFVGRNLGRSFAAWRSVEMLCRGVCWTVAARCQRNEIAE